MGSIRIIEKDPRKWVIDEELGQIKKNDDALLKVNIGIFSDYYDGPFLEWFLKSTFDKLQSGEYSIINIDPYSDDIFSIIDNKGIAVKKYEGICY